MPIYEYRCQACSHEFESIQKMSDCALTDCPKCHKPKLKKMVSAAGFVLHNINIFRGVEPLPDRGVETNIL